jgi:hypothetical protein
MDYSIDSFKPIIRLNKYLKFEIILEKKKEKYHKKFDMAKTMDAYR